MFIKDSAGNKSMTATLCVVAFVVVMVKVLFGGASVTLGGFSYQFGYIDSLSIAALLAPVLGTYAFRRKTVAEYGDGSVPIDFEEPTGESDRGR